MVTTVYLGLFPIYPNFENQGIATLNAIPLKEQNRDLNKEEFNDVLRLRYDIPLEDLPSSCTCGERFSINHAHLAVTKGDLL